MVNEASEIALLTIVIGGFFSDKSYESDKSDRSDRIGKHPRGYHSASPESRLAEPKTRGKGGAVFPSTRVVSLG